MNKVWDKMVSRPSEVEDRLQNAEKQNKAVKAGVS
jgi:hypothetical protein